MKIEVGSIWIDNDSDLLVIVKSLEGSCDGKVKVVFNYIVRTGSGCFEATSGLDLFLDTKTKLVRNNEGDYSKGYEHGVQHMKMQNSIDRYLDMSDKLSLTEAEVDNIIDDAFEEGYAQAYSELQSKTEREQALQEKAWDDGYDQAVYDLIDEGIVDGLDEEDNYSEYEFGDVEDDEEEYCFYKELDKILNGDFVIDSKPASNTKEDLVNNPSHYNSDPSGVKCIEITRHRNNNIGNVIKYVWRNGLKDGNSDIQDLEKAAWYLNDEIERLKGIE